MFARSSAAALRLLASFLKTAPAPPGDTYPSCLAEEAPSLHPSKKVCRRRAVTKNARLTCYVAVLGSA